jgi:hypothetical protein
MWSRVAIIFLGLLLAGCDPLYGVESRATLNRPVDVKCVNGALASVPEAGPVTYQRVEELSTEIFPKQRKVLTVTHDWLYGEEGKDILEVIQGRDGWDFSNSRRRMGVAVPHDEMVRFVPLMEKVNRAIETRCRLPVANLKAVALGETKSSDI